MEKKSLRHNLHHVDKRLQFRLRLYFLISLIILGVVGYDLFKGYITIFFALVGIVAGIGVGILTARMFHISWNHDAKKVMSRLDMFGVIVLICYIAFEIFREKIVGIFIHGEMLGPTSFAVLAGVMVGRVLGTRGKIIKVLKEQEII